MYVSLSSVNESIISFNAKNKKRIATSRAVRELTETLKELQYPFIEAGSRRLGYDNEDSDYDFIVSWDKTIHGEKYSPVRKMMADVNNKHGQEFAILSFDSEYCKVIDYPESQFQTVLSVQSETTHCLLDIHIIFVFPELFETYREMHDQLDRYLKNTPEALEFVKQIKTFGKEFNDQNYISNPFMAGTYIKGASIFRLLYFMMISGWKFEIPKVKDIPCDCLDLLIKQIGTPN